MKACSRRGRFALYLIAGCISGSASAAPPEIPFRSSEVQEGRSYLKSQVAVPTVGESAGQIAYTYPIEVPAGRGITPRVALEYSSSGRQSEYGYGWELTLPMVGRTQRLGVVDYGGNLYTYREGGTSYELVPTGVTTPSGGNEYKERTEQTFRRYLFYPASNQWRILTPSGQRYELGTANSSRRGKTTNLGPTGTAEWLVARIIDTNNNYASYEYTNGATRSARIARILYNGNAATGIPATWSVTFSWSTNFGTTANGFRSGFERRFGADILNDIVVSIPTHATTGNPALIPSTSPQSRTYHLSYNSLSGNTDNIHYLRSVQAGNFPPVVFDYANPLSQSNNDTEITVDTTGQQFPGYLGFTATVGGNSITRSTFVDATRDSRPDLIDTTSASTDSWETWISKGTYFEHQTWPAPLDLTGTAMYDQHALRVVSGTQTLQDFLDLDGDAYPDLIWIVSTNSGPMIKFCPGNGHGFDNCAPYGAGVPGTDALRKDTNPTGDTTATILDFVDMNGDGLVDILSLSGSQLAVYRNLGKGVGFSQSPVISTMPACPVTLVAGCLRLNQRAGNPNGNRRQLADIRDVNGDGLPDYIVNDYTTNEVRIAFGDGGAFLPFVSTGRYFSIGGGNQATDGTYSSRDNLIDMNGDGLADVFHIDCATGTYSIWFNDGGFWDSTPRTHTASINTTGHYAACMSLQQPWTLSSGENGVATLVQLADYDGDGAPDFVSASITPGTLTNVRVGQTLYRAPRLLLAASSENAHHIMSVEWMAANNGGLSDLSPGTLLTGGPTPVHVPYAVTRLITPVHSGQAINATSSTTFNKFDGAAFDVSEREFAGFSHVTAAGPQWGITSVTDYGTTLAQRGLVLARRLRNNSASGTGENTVNQYSYVPLAGGRTFAQLVSTETGPPATPALPQSTALTVYQAYNEFGGPTQWVEYGRQLDTDQYFNTRTYLTRADENFNLSVVAEETRAPGTAAGAAPVRTRRYYDDHSVYGLAPTAGNLVKVERDPGGRGPWVATEAFYDSNGNVYKKIDEMGVSTTFFYDPTYARFPVRETNVAGTVYRSFHALTAAQADECGPQYSGATFRCSRTEIDTFGRVTATWVPSFTGGAYSLALLSTVSYQDSSYPSAVTVTKRGVAHTVEYRDGLGNPVQIRAETSSGYRVYDSEYDSDGRVRYVAQPRLATGSGYDWSQQPTEGWSYDYDPVHDSLERTTFPKDAGDSGAAPRATQVVVSNRTVITDEDGRETDYLRDSHQRVVKVERYDRLHVAHNDTSYRYDVHNQIDRVTDPAGEVISYDRDLLGRLRSFTPPGLAAATYAYNARGQVVSTTDQRGVSVAYGFDAVGRLTSISSSGGGPDVRQVSASLAYYDTASDTMQLGWLRSETSDNITQTYAYDPEQSILSHQVSTLGISAQVSFAYDVGKRLRSVTYPDGNRADYEYDLTDTVRDIVGGATASPFYGYVFALLQRDDSGRLSNVWSDGGLNETYTYDARGRRTRVVSTHEAETVPGPLVDDTVVLSPAGDVTSLVRKGVKIGGVPRTTPDVFSITNDDFHQITRVDLNGALVAKYEYNTSGRLTTFNEHGTTSTSSSTYSNDRLTARTTDSLQQTWSYDAAGQVVSDDNFVGWTHNVHSHRWDAVLRYARSAAASGVSTDYFYTPSGSLSRVTSPSELPSTADNLYIGSWARLDMATGRWTDQISANGRLLIEATGATVEMPHRTLQDTVAAVTDGNGSIIRQEEFSPYGTRIQGGAQGGFELHFQGVRSDELVVAGGRAYDSRAGMWLARDPLHRDPSSLLSDVRLQNGYSFDFSNPYAYRDANGMFPGWDDLTDALSGEWDAVKDSVNSFTTDVSDAAGWVWDNKAAIGATVGVGALLAISDGAAAPWVVGETVGSGLATGGGAAVFQQIAATVRSFGGRGPVAQGAAGVNQAIADLEAAGGRVLGREITLDVGNVRTRLDLCCELPNKSMVFLEVKTGEYADLTKNQAAAFPNIWTTGAVPAGANAAAAGFTPGVPIGPTPVWVVHYSWPLK